MPISNAYIECELSIHLQISLKMVVILTFNTDVCVYFYVSYYMIIVVR